MIVSTALRHFPKSPSVNSRLAVIAGVFKAAVGVAYKTGDFEVVASVVFMRFNGLSPLGRPQVTLSLYKLTGPNSREDPWLLLKDSKVELGGSLEGALNTIIDPERVRYLKMDRFIALHDLTVDEADVCRLILQGTPINHIAEMRSTSPFTIKNQIASILNTTGVVR